MEQIQTQGQRQGISRFLSLKRSMQLLIRIYQRTLSLDHGPLARFRSRPTCRYHPTCSEYGHQAIGKYGVIKGGWMTAKRLARCTPWHEGGEDPVV